jgi:hypothetical protein
MRRLLAAALGAGTLLAGAGLVGLGMSSAHADAVAGPTLSVDLTASQHKISADIYGMNFADEALAKELKLPVRRWGGNATTRYNYAFDETNRGSDWFFENAAGSADPAGLPNGSETDTFVDQDRRTGTSSILTVPLIGWVPKARDASCGFSVAKYGAQQSTDQWRPDCGNGVKPDGTKITGNDPRDTSTPAGADYVKSWLGHLTATYGTAAQGGVRYYNLDNEPDIWFGTHRDVHPAGATYDEMRDQTYTIAGAVKAVDPGAQTLGPVGWGWTSLTRSGSDQQACGSATPPPNCWSSPPDYTAHGSVDFGAWYLQQLQAYERTHGQRILDYYDNHWYPQESNVALSTATDATTDALRLRSTRNLWDPTYTDESWINQPTQLIPRMKSLVAANYPGTKTAITEYNWGALNDINGALAQADVLGIFGREGLDLATLWAPPTAAQPGAYAFRMFRNFDGAGGQFGDTGVKATSTDQDQLSVYAATRPDGTVTLVIINKTGQTLTSPVNFANKLPPGATAQLYQYSAADTSKIVTLPNRTVGPAPVCATCPPFATMTGSYAPNSITTVVIGNGPSPSPSLSASPSASVSRSASPSASASRSASPSASVSRSASPSASASRSASPSASPTGSAGPSCAATYQITNHWTGGFQGDVTVRNTGRAATRSWTVTWTFSNGQQITNSWNAATTQAGAAVTASNVSWNGAISPGGTASFGFLANWTATNAVPTVSCSAT